MTSWQSIAFFYFTSHDFRPTSKFGKSLYLTKQSSCPYSAHAVISHPQNSYLFLQILLSNSAAFPFQNVIDSAKLFFLFLLSYPMLSWKSKSYSNTLCLPPNHWLLIGISMWKYFPFHTISSSCLLSPCPLASPSPETQEWTPMILIGLALE